MTAPPDTRLALTTARQPGAVAVLQLQGPAAGELLSRLTGQSDWQPGRLRLCDFAGIDQGLAGVLRPDWAQLMPHGGPRVVQKITDRLLELGAELEPAPAPTEVYPEADSALEAEALAAIARAASPAAIDLLLDQPRQWRDWLAAGDGAEDPGRILHESDRLDRLVQPATLVVVGRANVGKSTLTNRMLGRSVSVVADLPGTTRDWVAALAELNAPAAPPGQAGVALRWLDTPGLRREAEPLEREAIELARQVIASADVLLAMRDPDSDWPGSAELPREPELWVLGKADLAPARPAGDGSSPDAPLRVSGETGDGGEALEQAILARLGLDGVESGTPWAFCPALRQAVAADDRAAIARLLAARPA
ncbi:MAG: GTPase [Phycisphaeraceae bacterium]